MEKLRLVDIVSAESFLEGENTDSSEGPKEIELPEVIGILPVRNAVIFPGTVAPLAIGREKSRNPFESRHLPFLHQRFHRRIDQMAK